MHLTRLELAQPFGHYHLKVACIPISPQVHVKIIARKILEVKLWGAVFGSLLGGPVVDVGEAVHGSDETVVFGEGADVFADEVR